MSGRQLGDTFSQESCKAVTIQYTSAVVTQAWFIAQFPCRLVAINGRPRVAGNDVSAVNFTFFKTKSGVADAKGVSMSGSSYDLKGTADANQTVALVGDASLRTFVAGDALSVVLTGTPTLAVGEVTCIFDPV